MDAEDMITQLEDNLLEGSHAQSLERVPAMSMMRVSFLGEAFEVYFNSRLSIPTEKFVDKFFARLPEAPYVYMIVKYYIM